MKTYTTHSAILLRGRLVSPGDTVELTDDEATALGGDVTLVVTAPLAKKEADDNPDIEAAIALAEKKAAELQKKSANDDAPSSSAADGKSTAPEPTSKTEKTK